MAGFCLWVSPRQILINEKAPEGLHPEPGVETEATRTCLPDRARGEIKRGNISVSRNTQPLRLSGGDPDLALQVCSSQEFVKQPGAGQFSPGRRAYPTSAGERVTPRRNERSGHE
jgi:hypothetical protein